MCPQDNTRWRKRYLDYVNIDEYYRKQYKVEIDRTKWGKNTSNIKAVILVKAKEASSSLVDNIVMNFIGGVPQLKDIHDDK
jgi:hypothetical protein